MVLNYIWIAFFVIAFVIALVKLIFMGDFEVFPEIRLSFRYFRFLVECIEFHNEHHLEQRKCNGL